MSEEIFKEIYQTYNFKEDIELETYNLFLKIQEELNKRLINKNQTYSKYLQTNSNGICCNCF